MSKSGSSIIAALEYAWQDIQKHHPELPAVVLVTGRRRQKSEAKTRGQHCKNTWVVREEQGHLTEIVIFGERLADGGTAVMNTLIHEAAHELCHTRDVKDTSNRARYHNKVFMKAAEELGLEGPAVSGGPTLGYSNCVITEVTTRLYQAAIENLGTTCRLYVSALTKEEEKKPRKPVRLAVCECPEDEENSITWSKKYQKRFEDTGYLPLLCATCHHAFTPEDAEEA